MASYLGPVLLITAAILLIEIACGRHRGIYRKEDWLVIGLPAVPWIFAVAFVSNRVLDILKPFPARSLQVLPGGWGIVIDGVPRFRGVLFSDWTAVPSSAQKFIDTVKSRLGL